MKFSAIVFMAALLPHMSQAALSGPITVAWRNKPPMHYIENGVEQGYLLDRAKQVFSDAGIPAIFVEEPSKRIWANFAAGVTSYCSIGWFRLRERESLVQYSAIFHTDRPPIVLAAPATIDKVKAHRTLASLLADKDLTFGVVDGVSYGPALDDMIRHAANVERRTVEPVQMARMVAANRLSYMVIGRDDVDYASQHDFLLRAAVRLDFPDWPPGLNLNRYIVCSKDVSAETMGRINKAIEAVWKPKPAKK